MAPQRTNNNTQQQQVPGTGLLYSSREDVSDRRPFCAMRGVLKLYSVRAFARSDGGSGLVYKHQFVLEAHGRLYSCVQWADAPIPEGLLKPLVNKEVEFDVTHLVPDNYGQALWLRAQQPVSWVGLLRLS